MRSRADPFDPFSPLTKSSGCRLNAEYIRTLYWRSSHRDIEAKLTYSRGGYLLQTGRDSRFVSILMDRENQFVLLANSEKIAGQVYSHGESFVIVTEGKQVTLRWMDPVSVASQAEHAEGNLSAPMPGTLVAVLVGKGETVTKGAPLVTMEAMKMEHTIVAVENGGGDEGIVKPGEEVDGRER